VQVGVEAERDQHVQLGVDRAGCGDRRLDLPEVAHGLDQDEVRPTLAQRQLVVSVQIATGLILGAVQANVAERCRVGQQRLERAPQNILWLRVEQRPLHTRDSCATRQGIGDVHR